MVNRHSTTKTLRKILRVMELELRPVSKNYLVKNHNIDHGSATDALDFLLINGLIREVNASANGRLFELVNQNVKATQEM